MKHILLLLLCSVVAEILCVSSYFDDPRPVIYSGQANIALLTSIHSSGGNKSLCGPIRQEAVQEAMAAVWAAHQINTQKDPGDISIGVYIYDTCERQQVTERQAFRLLPLLDGFKYASCQPQALPPVFGVIAGESSQAMGSTAGLFQALDTPVVVTEPIPEALLPQSNVFTTTLRVEYQAKIVADVVKISGFDTVGLAATRESDLNVAQQTLEDAGVTVLKIRIAGKSPACDHENLPSFEEADVEAVALFLTDDHTFQVIEDSDWKNINKSVLISTDRDLTSRLRKTLSTSLISVLHSVLFLWPSSGDVPEFQTYFRNIIQENSVSPHPLVQELWHSMMKSSGQEFVHKGFVFPKEMKAFALPSTGKVSSGYPVFNTIKAVWTLALGLKTAQQRQCRPGSDCFLTQTNALGPAVLQALQNNQNVLLETPVTFKEGKQLMFNDVFPNNGQVILTSVSGDGVFREVGRYSDKTGLITHKMTVLQHRKATTPNYYSQQIPPASLRSSALTMNPKHELSSLPTTSKKQLSSVLVTNIQNTSFGAWINRTWCLVTIAFSGAGVLVTLYVLVFLLMKFCDKTVKKNTIVISMFQLLALITMYVGALLFTFQPSFAMCGARKVVHNVAYAFNYGCLLLRAMSLRSQKTLGLGGSISQVNQMLTLLFVVGAQVALEVQWWILRPPGVVFEPGELLECSISRGDFLVCQSYIIFLLVVAVLMAFFSRNTPYCYREGYCVTVTSLLCLTVFFVWVVAFGLLPKDEDRGFSASVAQISTATVILGGIFGPQLYSLHKYGKNIHKPLSYADSLSTVFTMFKDIDSVSGGSTSSLRGKKSAKTLESPYSGEVIQNPLYDELNSAYP